MPPVGVGASRFASALETGEAKLWALLIGVNDYQDSSLPPLHYPALDCQGIGDALAAATQAFPHTEFLIHHDRCAGDLLDRAGKPHCLSELPILSTVQASLQRVVSSAQAEDTVLVYFSGHGVLEPNSKETILCLHDTDRADLLTTGLQLQAVLEMLGSCLAHKQLLWLDACHSGNISLSGTKGSDDDRERPIFNATPQVLQLLRQRAVNSRGFYALLSCDEGQQSWEFPDLGHGVFSYYLMRGLRGEAADRDGVIDADSLYRYVYRQTVQYIDRTNHQVRLVNQHKRYKGEKNLYPEYSPQTPKRIVAGVGEIILGIKPSQTPDRWQERYALILDGIGDRQIVDPLSHVLQREGKFQLEYIAPKDLPGSDVRERIQIFLRSTRSGDNRGADPIQPIATRLLYLRGQTANLGNGDGSFILKAGSHLSRSWLRQELRRSAEAQQTIVLDCPGATDLADWVEELKIAGDRSQCIIASPSLPDDPELFAQVMLEALISAPSSTGLSVASLLARIQSNLEGLGVECQSWLSGTQGLIEVLPATADLDREELPLTGEISIPEPVAISPEPPRSQPIVTAPSVEPILPAQFDRELENILARLVGPIAPTLVDRVTQKLQTYDPNTLLDRILPLLPIPVREELTREVKQLFQPEQGENPAPANNSLPEDIHPPARGNQRTIPPAGLPVTQPQESHLDRTAIEQILRELVGPVGPILLKQIDPLAGDSGAPEPLLGERSLVDALSPYLTVSQRTELARRITDSIEPSKTSAPIENTGSIQTANGRGIAAPVSSPADRAAAIDDRFIQRCERELTQEIGPIAKFIVTSTHKVYSQISTSEFVAILASHIPQPQQAEAFRQRLTRGNF